MVRRLFLKIGCVEESGLNNFTNPQITGEKLLHRQPEGKPLLRFHLSLPRDTRRRCLKRLKTFGSLGFSRLLSARNSRCAVRVETEGEPLRRLSACVQQSERSGCCSRSVGTPATFWAPSEPSRSSNPNTRERACTRERMKSQLDGAIWSSTSRWFQRCISPQTPLFL